MTEETDNQEEGLMDESAEEETPHGYFSKLEARAAELMHDVPEAVHEVFKRHRRTAFERHPFLFSTLGLFGLVATWQGFDDVVARIEIFNTYPTLLLIIGLLILLFTGRLYRHLDR